MKKHSYTKKQLIREVEQGSKIGKLLTKIELEFLRALGKGKLYKD